MPRIIAILYEEKREDSYVAIQLDADEPEVLFMKGPGFEKQMGPFPLPYAEATFEKWDYCRVENPPEVNVQDPESLVSTMLHLEQRRPGCALYCPEDAERA